MFLDDGLDIFHRADRVPDAFGIDDHRHPVLALIQTPRAVGPDPGQPPAPDRLLERGAQGFRTLLRATAPLVPRLAAVLADEDVVDERGGGHEASRSARIPDTPPCAAAPAFLLQIGRLLRPSRPDKIKLQPYECGLPQASEPSRQPHIRYYTFALLFIVFDVETVLLFATASVLKGRGMLALTEVSVFAALVGLALVYAWRAGVLEWE